MEQDQTLLIRQGSQWKYTVPAHNIGSHTHSNLHNQRGSKVTGTRPYKHPKFHTLAAGQSICIGQMQFRNKSTTLESHIA